MTTIPALNTTTGSKKRLALRLIAYPPLILISTFLFYVASHIISMFFYNYNPDYSVYINISMMVSAVGLSGFITGVIILLKHNKKPLFLMLLPFAILAFSILTFTIVNFIFFHNYGTGAQHPFYEAAGGKLGLHNSVHDTITKFIVVVGAAAAVISPVSLIIGLVQHIKHNNKGA